MTDLDDFDLFPEPDDREPRPCKHPRWRREPLATAEGVVQSCGSCGHVFDDADRKRGRNNRTRGNAAELDVARALGGRKVGPLGHSWDVEMPGYARLQVKKQANPPSVRAIVSMLDDIGSGAEMPGVVWIEPGRGGEQLIVFRLRDYAERHGAK